MAFLGGNFGDKQKLGKQHIAQVLTLTNHELCTHAETHTDRPNVWFTSLTDCIQTVEAILMPDICFCIKISKLTSYFPETENAMATCLVFFFVSHAAFSFVVACDIQNLSMCASFAHMFNSLSHLQKDGNWKTHGCYVPHSLFDCVTWTEMWHTTAKCLRPPRPHTSAVSLNISFLHTGCFLKEKQRPRQNFSYFFCWICALFTLIMSKMHLGSWLNRIWILNPHFGGLHFLLESYVSKTISWLISTDYAESKAASINIGRSICCSIN